MALEVLHVIDSLAHGGAEQNLLSMVRRLPRDRFVNHVAWLYPDDRLASAFRPHVESLIAPPGGRLAPFHAAARLAAWIRRHKPDVVHAQLLRAHLFARLAAAAAGGPPMVTTWQNTIYDRGSFSDFGGSALLRRLLLETDRVTSRSVHRFVAVSQHVATHWTSRLGVPHDRVRVIFNAVEPERYHDAASDEVGRLRSSLGLPPSAPVLLSVGRLVHGKAHEDTIAALPRILRRFPTALLLIAGAGPLLDELAGQVRALGLDRHVRLLGQRRDVPLLYQLADAFVFATRSEGLSVALGEVLASGLPAAVSDIPPNREVAAGVPSVRFFRPGEVAEIADAACELLDGGAAVRAAARSARDDVRARFSPDALAAALGDTLEEAALNGAAAARNQPGWA